MNAGAAVIFALVLGPLLYLLVASFAQPAHSLDDYFFGERKVRPSDFVDTTFMYGVQIAALVLFVTWSYTYGAWALLVPLFWAIGYLLFSLALFLPRVRASFFSSSFGTLHAFLGNVHDSKALAVVAALVTLTALAGPAMFEPYFTAGAIAAALGSDEAHQANIQMLCFLCFVAISAIYLVIGGFRTVVATNRWQLFIGYTAFNVFLGFLIFQVPGFNTGVRDNFAAFMLLFAVSLLILSLLIQWRQRQWDVLSTLSHSISTALFLALLVVHSSDFSPRLMGSFFAGQFGEMFNWYALVGLFIANAMYQFVDVGQWQRVLAIDISDGSGASDAHVKTVAISNLIAGLASSVSWCVAIFFGLFLKSAMPSSDPSNVISGLLARLVSNGDAVGAFLLVTALLAIMFSTLDALCSAVSFTVQNDIFRQKRVLVARFVTVLILIVYIAYYLFMRAVTGEKLDAILYASWSLQIGLLPAVVAALGNRRSPAAAILSIVGGTFGALLLLFMGMANQVFELAPILALAGSLIGFGIGTAADLWLDRHKTTPDIQVQE